MKKIKLTESMLTNLIEKVISERKQLKEQKKINNVLKRLYENEKKDCERIKKELANLRKKYLL